MSECVAIDQEVLHRSDRFAWSSEYAVKEISAHNLSALCDCMVRECNKLELVLHFYHMDCCLSSYISILNILGIFSLMGSPNNMREACYFKLKSPKNHFRLMKL
jgi:hypothetical protein